MSNMKPTITLIIRSATPTDYERCEFLDHSWSTEFVWQMGIDETESNVLVNFRTARLPRSTKMLYPRSEEALVQSWRLHSAFLVAQWEEDVVGYVNVREESAQECAWVADMVVDRSHRLRGIGSSLLRATREWALSHHLRRLIVETQTKNYPAIAFLQKRGLVFCGYNDQYFPNQDIAVFFGHSLR